MDAKNSELRRKVIAELEWEPIVDASRIGVTAIDGIVTLTGSVGNYSEKEHAEGAAKRVTGVTAVVDELTISFLGSATITDNDIAASATAALKYNAALPRDRVEVVVAQGWITLDGNVDWQYQRAAAENCVKYVLGVKGVTNRVAVKAPVRPLDVKATIQSALVRNAQIDTNKVSG